MNVASFVKQRRKSLGLTQMQLAITAGVSLPTVQNLEAGKTNPTIKLFEKITSSLGCSMDVNSLQPDWDYLIHYGLSVSSIQEASKDQTFSFQHFAQEIIKATDDVMLHQQAERFKEALLALLCTLQIHYPTYFDYFFSQNQKILYFMKQKMDRGRIIKLSRMSLAVISKYL
ncbi:MAG: helix-turn-helix domain-containing protein [Deltaproteobacteria bacterium]|nr:helix-turn-helix domain-containing protein [Deltaproteobacteria bacterium]